MTGREGGQSVVIVRYDFSEIQLEEGLVYQNSPPVTQQTSSVNTGKIRNNALVSSQYNPGFVTGLFR